MLQKVLTTAIGAESVRLQVVAPP